MNDVIFNLNAARITEVIDVNLLLLFGGVYKKYQKDEYIFHEDQQPHFYHQIVEGKIKMVNETDEGKEFIQGIFSPGQSFGEPPIFNNSSYPASAMALQATTVLRLTIPAFTQLLKENFEAHFNITKLLSQRLKAKSKILKEITCYTPEHRILSLLDNIKHEQNSTTDIEAERVKIDFTRKQIAEMTGLRVETVIRVMRGLFEKKILIIEKGKVFY